MNIESWYHPEIIFSCYTVLVAARNDGSMKNINAKITSLKEKYDCNIEVIFVEATDISSSEIRMHLSEHKDEIPNQIYKYIKANYNIATRCTLNGGRCRNICKAI